MYAWVDPELDYDLVLEGCVRITVHDMFLAIRTGITLLAVWVRCGKTERKEVKGTLVVELSSYLLIHCPPRPRQLR